MMQTLKKAKDIAMARIEAAGAKGDVILPSWFVKVAAGVFLVFVAISSAALTSWAQVGQNTKDIANHETRIVKLEDKAEIPSILAERLDGTNKRLDETNRRLDLLLGQKEVPANGR